MTQTFGMSSMSNSSPRQQRCPPPLQLNKCVKKYELSHTLGTGTYGQVYKCHSTADKGRQPFAVKVANKEAAYRRSALNESKVLQLLADNKETVRWVDTYEEGGHICIVTELLAKTIYDVMKERNFQALSLSDVRAVALNVSKSISALHRAGYMHCDIKPENIMLRSLEEGVRSSCLIDFGAVRLLSENAYYDIQSLWYRAPEVLCSVPYTPKIDAWSLGCLIYELATGGPLFPGNSASDEVIRIVDIMGSPSLEACSRVQGMSLPYIPGPTPRAVTVIDEKVYQIHGRNPTSEALVHLLYNLLNPDESSRMSCEGALSHPFLSESTQNMSPSGSFSQYPPPSMSQIAIGVSTPHRPPQLSQCIPTTPLIGTPNTSNASIGQRTANAYSMLGSSGSGWPVGPGISSVNTPQVLNNGYVQMSPLIAPQIHQLPPMTFGQPVAEMPPTLLPSSMGLGVMFPALCVPNQSQQINFMRHSPNHHFSNPSQAQTQSLIMQQSIVPHHNVQPW